MSYESVLTLLENILIVGKRGLLQFAQRDLIGLASQDVARSLATCKRVSVAYLNNKEGFK